MQTPRRKIGISNLYDAVTGISQNLPANFQIYHYTDKVWIGGSVDAKYYLQIERIKGKHIPTILAEGDLDLFLTSVKPPNPIDQNLSGVQVAGNMRSLDIRGYLAKADLAGEDNFSYLVLVATAKGSPVSPCIDFAINIAQEIAAQKIVEVAG